ncbi:M28 family peptidase [candidate division WOR-3 bacterium]|uniref:M28 family peptidase n=1 Tax=candidate division WOR-3 bacterium TaxID=2052148 RepID=A0A937XF99_UNCW3|nr:M28 family peptidase [candidate division WOR-3 bacterium]
MLRKSLFLIIAVGLSLCLAGEFLALVPNTAPDDLAGQYTVVGVTGRGTLVLGDESELADLFARDGSWLAADPKDHLYFTVRLFAQASRTDLAAVSRILDFDGEQYLVEVESDAVERFIAVPAMRGRISLNGWVMDRPTPKLPVVLSNPSVEQIVARVSSDSVLAFVRRLQQYRNRYSTGDSCKAAAQWIAATFRAYGCDTVILQNHTTNHAPNVVGVRYGTSGQRSPYAIIDGHFDAYAASNAPGADDNASGTVSAIEACRVTQGFQFRHDLRFIAFSGEEFGLLGSEYYAGRARSQGDSILGVLNFDMIAYEDSAPEDLEVIGKIASPACGPFVDWFIAVADTYTSLPCSKEMVSDMQSSDQGPFWNNGYLGFCGIEDYWPGNPYYHTPGDSIGAGYNNNNFCTEVIRAGVAALATMGEPVPQNVPSVGLLHKLLDDSAGNDNGKWDAGESVAVFLTLKNFGMAGATGVSAAVSSTDPYVTLYNVDAAYGDIAGLDTAVNAVPFTMKAAPNTPREHVADFDLTISSAESSWQTTFSFPIGEYLNTDPIPDGPRVPARYWAYDDVDTLYPEHPNYEWVEVNAQGTRLTFSDNDDVVPVSLPAAFGPFRYYGRSYSQISVSADGWIAAGNYTTSNFDNTILPSTSAPRATVFANWDDLYPVSGSGGAGYVYWFHDSANHRFIVEYDSVKYYSGSNRDKFEVIFYDTTVTTPTGDNVIVAQYKTAAGFTSSTVGIQDSTRAIAIQDLFNGTLAHGASPIVPGRAIKYTTAPGTGVAEPTRRLTPDAFHLTLDRNPVCGSAQVRFSLRQASSVRLEAFDRTGRKLTTLVSSFASAGSHATTWDTREVPTGIYFLRLTAAGGQRSLKVVVGR